MAISNRQTDIWVSALDIDMFILSGIMVIGFLMQRSVCGYQRISQLDSQYKYNIITTGLPDYSNAGYLVAVP